MIGTVLIWLVGLVVAALLGSVCQLLLWWNGDRKFGEALVHEPSLWGFYLLVGVLVGEHLRRLWMSDTERCLPEVSATSPNKAVAADASKGRRAADRQR